MKLLRYCVWCLLCGAGWAYAQTGAAALEKSTEEGVRARIEQKSQAIDQALKQAETACYQRFAVEDCLRKERQNARKAQALLRQQKAVLDDAERRERAAQRLKAIAERELPTPAPATAHVKEASPPLPPPQPRPENALPASRPEDVDRDQQAQGRARQQQEKRKAHQARQAEAVSSQAAQAAKARQLREEKNAAAAQHKAQVLQSQADEAAAGRTPAAPLSPVP